MPVQFNTMHKKMAGVTEENRLIFRHSE